MTTMNDYEKIMAKLDQNNPRWWLQWADQVDLYQLAAGSTTEKNVRQHVALQLFGPIIAAAVGAGVVNYD